MKQCQVSLTALEAEPKHLSISSATDKGLNYFITDSVQNLTEAWDMLAETPLLQRDFLLAIETAPPIGMRFLYMLLYNGLNPIGIFYFQEVPFQAGQSINYQGDDNIENGRCPSFFGQLHLLIRKQVARKIGFSTLVCGNLLLTGPYGARFHKDIPIDSHHNWIEFAFNKVENWLSEQKREVPPVQLIKEFYSQGEKHLPFRGEKKWHGFRIQPNHIMHIPASWNTMEDYVNALQSKYRVRYRRALKKKDQVFIRELNLEETRKFSSALYHLYLQIAGNAGFNMVHLQSDYIASTKEHLGDGFKVFVFEKEGQLVGFYSYFMQGGNMDVHYIGLNKSENIAHQLYLNMLFQVIEDAIMAKCKSINFGRTAPEIKSSVGAETIQMDCYIRHQSPLIQKSVPLLLDFLQPKLKWEERHPFNQTSTLSQLKQ